MNRTCHIVQPFESPGPSFVFRRIVYTRYAAQLRGPTVLLRSPMHSLTKSTDMGFLNVDSGWRLVVGLTC